MAGLPVRCLVAGLPIGMFCGRALHGDAMRLCCYLDLSLLTGFNLRESQAEVKSLVEGGGASWEERCAGVQRHYQALSREYKRTEKKLTECQKKLLEVWWVCARMGQTIDCVCVCMCV